MPDTALPEVDFTTGAIDPIGYRADQTNSNTVRYVAGGYPAAGSALSITVATYDTTGAFVDADVIINGLPGLTFALLDPSAPPLSADASLTAPYDLQNVLTHEAGHFFGMAHADSQPDDTMFPTSAQGETKKRTLTDDDAAGLRALYPDAFQASCSAAARGGASSASWFWAAGLVLAGAALLRRRSNLRFAGAPLVAAAFVGLTATGARAAAPHLSVDTTAVDMMSASATVVASEGWWDHGVAYTAVDLDVTCPNAASCPARQTRVELVGGTIDGLTQVVSGRRVPTVGEHIALPARAGGYLWPEHLAPSRASRAASLVVESTEN